MNHELRTINNELLPAIRVAGRTKKGFSLMEVLLAIGILSIGMIFIAGVFPAAIYMTTFSTEQSIAAAAADEAFAKIKLYVKPSGIDRIPYNGQMLIGAPPVPLDPNVIVINQDEFLYPSTNAVDRQYYWSAICRRTNPATSERSVQVTVFVCRKVGSSLNWQVPVQVGVAQTTKPDEILIVVANPANPVEKTFINDGYTIVENRLGHIYRVLERYSPPNDNVVKLDRKWLGGSGVWVVPPPAGGGRYPCVAVYQKVIRF